MHSPGIEFCLCVVTVRLCKCLKGKLSFMLLIDLEVIHVHQTACCTVHLSKQTQSQRNEQVGVLRPVNRYSYIRAIDTKESPHKLILLTIYLVINTFFFIGL